MQSRGDHSSYLTKECSFVVFLMYVVNFVISEPQFEDASMYRLLEHNLIEEAGKLDLPGRPMSYRVTEEFLKKFVLSRKVY